MESNIRETASLLIVDDSKMSRTLIRNFITRIRPGWQVFEADNGSAALTFVRQRKPDFISMDVNMPGTSGLEAAEALVGEKADVRIVMMTANTQEATKNNAGRLKVGFCGKPVVGTVVQKMVYYFENGEMPPEAAAEDPLGVGAAPAAAGTLLHSPPAAPAAAEPVSASAAAANALNVASQSAAAARGAAEKSGEGSNA